MVQHPAPSRLQQGLPARSLCQLGFQFFLYRTVINRLVPFAVDGDCRFPRRDDDNNLAIQRSMIFFARAAVV